MGKSKLLQVRVPVQDAEELKRIAASRGISLADLVRRLLGRALRCKEYEDV